MICINIGYDVHPLFAGSYKDHEVGEYCKNLVSGAESTGGEKVYIFNCYDDSVAGVSQSNARTYSIRKKRTDDYLTETDPFVRIIAAQMQHFCVDNDIDIMHFFSPFNFEPASLLKVPQKTAKILTVYDFLPAIYPEHYLTDPDFKHHYLRQKELMTEFDAFICVSKTTADDLADYTGVQREKIFVVEFGFEPALADLVHPVDETVLYNLGAAKTDMISWREITEKTFEVYREVVRRKAESLRLAAAQQGKKRIAWFSPLPQAPSGIADFSYEILKLLEKRMDIDIFIDDGYTPDVPGLTSSKIYSHTLFEKMYSSVNYDAVIYQMGSSGVHTYTMRYIKNYPGIVVSHDSSYHPVLYHHIKGDVDCLQYREALRIEFGIEKGDAAFEDIGTRKENHIVYQQRYPMNNYYLGDTKKLVTTTGFNKVRALEKEIGRDVSVIHLHSWVPENFYSLNRSDIRKKFGIPEAAPVIGVFGSVHYHKRVLEAVKAFDIIASEFDDVRLCLVGGHDLNYYNEVFSYIKRSRHIRGKIVITGAVSDDDFFSYMKITDVFLGLRSDAHSASGPLLQALAAGLACIVSDVDVFDSIDDDTVIKVGIDDDEITNLAAEMRKLLLDENYRKELGVKAKKLSETMFSAVKTIDEYEKVINEFDSVMKKVLLTNNDVDNLIVYFGENFDSGENFNSVEDFDSAAGQSLREWAGIVSKEVTMLNRISEK